MPAPARVPPAALARAVERIRHHLYRLHQRLVPAPAAMMEMIIAAWTSQAISAAAQLGVADALSDGPLALDELANRVGADADALARLLRALLGKGVFRRRRDGRYELNALAATLCSDAPASTLWPARFYGSCEQRERWSLLAQAIRTGDSIVPALRGTHGFAYFSDNAEHAHLFNRTMTSISELTTAAVVAGYDFGSYAEIVDVGGGQGSLLAAILAAAPASRGTLYDVPGVLAGAAKVLRDNGVEGRVRLAEGSFFDSVPGGGDAYVLKNILHDWSDDRAVRILRNVRAAAGPEAAVLLIELVVCENERDFVGNWADLEMLLNLGGRERTAAEYAKLLSRAGFRPVRVVRTASPLSVVEARPCPEAAPL